MTNLPLTALVAHGPKDLRLEEQEGQTPGAGEVKLRLARGGICGSDLHYYSHGGFGTVRLKEPMILGHEVAGHVVELGAGVTGLSLGDLVALSPSRPCGVCAFCAAGLQNHCENMRFYGSAMPFPHIQGAFRQEITALASQCAPAAGLSAAEAALAEPLAVVLHAARRAGDLMGRRVMVTGCGPIGLLAVAVARAAGAVEIFATDLTDFALAKARDLGADRTVNVARDAARLHDFARGKGHFDMLFECSGAAAALTAAVPLRKPQSTILQLGLGGDMTLPLQAMTAKELVLKGSFRFHEEFFTAVELMQSGRLTLAPLISHSFPLTDYAQAFELALDRTQALKVQLALNEA